MSAWETLLRRLAIASLYRAAEREKDMEMKITHDILRPIVGIENRTAQEIFDIMCNRIRRAASPAGVVKPLEFKYHAIPPTGESLAQSVVGLYCIQHGWQNFRLRFRDSETLGDFKTIEAAKAAAQADYEARIMAAIEPAGVGVDAEAPSTHVSGLDLADAIRRGIKDQGYGYTLKGDKLTVSSDEVFAIDLAKLADFIRAALATEGKDNG